MAAMAGEGGATMSPLLEGFIAKTITEAMSYIFTGSLVILAIAFIMILFVPQISLRGRAEGQNLEKAADGSSPSGPDEPAGAVKAK